MAAFNRQPIIAPILSSSATATTTTTTLGGVPTPAAPPETGLQPALVPYPLAKRAFEARATSATTGRPALFVAPSLAGRQRQPRQLHHHHHQHHTTSTATSQEEQEDEYRVMIEDCQADDYNEDYAEHL
jgi:hypothetical protein